MADFSCGFLRFGQNFLDGEKKNYVSVRRVWKSGTPACVFWLDSFFLTTQRA